jgi:Rieske Fe-S protein
MSISRRTFVKGSLASLPVVAAASGCGNDVAAAPIVDATVDADQTSPRYGQIEIAVPRYPDLAAAGGAVMLRLADLPPGNYPFVVPTRGILLVHRGSPGDPHEFIATRADCPHQGCPLGYAKGDDLIECPCHGSRFLASPSDTDPTMCVGKVVHLPAMDNLTVYGIQQLGDFVYVDLNTDQSCGVRSDLPAVANGKITIPIAQYPSLQNAGGTLVGKPAGLDDKLMIARVSPAEIVCVSAICTHQGCTIALDLPHTDFQCPCHGSRFSFDGAVLNGPAPTSVKKYPVTFDQMTAVITVT